MEDAKGGVLLLYSCTVHVEGFTELNFRGFNPMKFSQENSPVLHSTLRLLKCFNTIIQSSYNMLINTHNETFVVLLKSAKV